MSDRYERSSISNSHLPDRLTEQQHRHVEVFVVGNFQSVLESTTVRVGWNLEKVKDPTDWDPILWDHRGMIPFPCPAVSQLSDNTTVLTDWHRELYSCRDHVKYITVSTLADAAATVGFLSSVRTVPAGLLWYRNFLCTAFLFVIYFCQSGLSGTGWKYWS